MAWITENRRTQVVERRPEPYLSNDMKIDIARKYFPRYPTKRAVLLPALHAVQHVHGWLPVQALEEIAEFLELAPAEVMDTATFYEEYWLKPKGQYLIQVCRSLSCEACGHENLTEHCRRKLGIDLGETTPDGRFTLVELECLGACEQAPCALVNETLHGDLTVEALDRVISGLPPDAHDYKDPFITWDEGHGHAHAHAHAHGGGGGAAAYPSPGEPQREPRDPHGTKTE